MDGSAVKQITYWRASRLLSLALLLGMISCSDKQRATPRARKVVKQEAIEEVKVDTPKAPIYVYTPVGKRDPFKSEYKIVKGPEKHIPGGVLTKYEIDQLKLTAIISGIARPTAQVELPDGKGVNVKVGTRIGKNFGRVVQIKRDVLVIAEDYPDWTGRKITNHIYMRLEKKK